MKTHEDEIAASWNRAKVSLGARLRLHSGFDLGALKSIGIHVVAWNAMKTYEIHENR